MGCGRGITAMRSQRRARPLPPAGATCPGGLIVTSAAEGTLSELQLR
jgi:hypothetical protein